MSNAAAKAPTHVVDILGNVKGRDQPIMLMDKAAALVELLGEDLFLNDDVVFFDAFCKAGEVLLSCAFLTAKYKSKKNKHAFDIKEIQKDLYQSNRYFALAPDERHHRISLRTFLGNENSHKPELSHIIRNGNYLSEIDGTLNKEKFKTEFESMINYIKQTTGKSKIIALGNPPYQEADGGHGASARMIYPFFVESLISSDAISEFVLVIPSRWFSSGKNLDDFRERMLTEGKVKTLSYFERSEDVFPTVHVQGGICFLHWKRDHKGMTNFEYKKEVFETDLSRFDIIPDDPYATPIITKILNNWKGQFVSEVAWSRKPFGLSTDYFNKNQESKSGLKDSVKCLVRGKKIKYLKRSEIEKNQDKIDEWKVAIPKAYATGARRCTLPAHQIFLIEKGTICTETYNILSSFKTKSEAERMISYLGSDFCRYLLGLRKLTQDIPKDRWAWVPYFDVARDWTEEEMFKQLKISKEEQVHIKAKVKEW